MWSNGDTTEDLNDLIAGIYALTITDAAGCLSNYFDTIFHAPPIEYHILIQQDSTNSTADVLIQNLGQSDLSYLWFDTSTDSIITDLMPGDYALTLTDPYGCIRDTTVQIPLITFVHDWNKSAIQLYPIPAKSHLFINYKNIDTTLEINIIALNGQSMIKRTIKPGLNRININKLSAGVYQIPFSIRNEQKMLQFIKD